MGTPAYMPPEQAQGAKSVTTAADIYSLGATLYETLTGQPPFAGESSAEILRQVLDHEPARPRSINPKLDRDLETICLKCLEKEPSRRYSSAAALADDLDRWRAGLPITARPVPMWEKAVKWVKRKPAMAALVLTVPLGLLALIGGGIWFTLQLLPGTKPGQPGPLCRRHEPGPPRARRRIDLPGSRAVEGLSNRSPGAGRSPELRMVLPGEPLRSNADTPTWAPRSGDLRGIPPGRQPVVSGGSDGTVRVWDSSGRQAPEVKIGKGGSVHCVAISPDGRWLAAGDAGGGLRLWELETVQGTSPGRP